MNRLRIVSYTVQPNFMVDDGDNLIPLPIQPVTITASDWPKVLGLIAEGIEQVRAQIEGVAPTDTE